MGIHEECAVFAAFSHNQNVVPFVARGLENLQHRGIQSCGISISDSDFKTFKSKGLVKDVLNAENTSGLFGHFAIGHNRYSTVPGDLNLNAQPIELRCNKEKVAIAHNGHLKNRQEFINLDLETNCDSEILLKLCIEHFKKEPSKWQLKEVKDFLQKNFENCAYSVVFLMKEKIFAIRDKCGFRPLFFAKAKEGFFVASEDVGFASLNCEYVKEIKPNCAVEINKNGAFFLEEPSFCEKKCVFEHIYFSHLKSHTFGKNTAEIRKKLGQILAIENPVKNANCVVPIPNSAIMASFGFAKQANLPLKFALIKKENSNRTFIESEDQREIKVREKFVVKPGSLEGKSVVVVDDSLVRGTSAKVVVHMLKNIAKAKEVHIRIACPKLVETCFWGVDIKKTSELICHNFEDEDKLCKQLDASSLKFLSLEKMQDFFGHRYCYNCFGAALNLSKIRSCQVITSKSDLSA